MINYIRLFNLPPATTGTLWHAFNVSAWAVRNYLDKHSGVRIHRIEHLDYSTEALLSFRDPRHAACVLKCFGDCGVMPKLHGRGVWNQVNASNMFEKGVIDFTLKQSLVVDSCHWRQKHRERTEKMLSETISRVREAWERGKKENDRRRGPVTETRGWGDESASLICGGSGRISER